MHLSLSILLAVTLFAGAYGQNSLFELPAVYVQFLDRSAPPPFPFRPQQAPFGRFSNRARPGPGPFERLSFLNDDLPLSGLRRPPFGGRGPNGGRPQGGGPFGGRPFGGRPFGGRPFGGGPFGSGPFGNNQLRGPFGSPFGSPFSGPFGSGSSPFDLLGQIPQSQESEQTDGRTEKENVDRAN